MSDNIRDEQFLADIRSAAQGEATEYNLGPIIRKEFYYKDIITALQNGGGGGGGFTPTQSQLDAMNSGIDSEKVAQIATNETNISKVTDTVAQGGQGYQVINGIRVYVSATAPTGDIPDGSIWIGG